MVLSNENPDIWTMIPKTIIHFIYSLNDGLTTHEKEGSEGTQGKAERCPRFTTRVPSFLSNLNIYILRKMESATFGGGTEIVKKTFLNHVFSTTEEGKAEILNVLQYAGLAVVPIVVLNKVVQRFIPDADPDKSSLEIVVEILLQLSIILVGIVLIHRSITFFPAYSGFPYGNLLLTNSILTFLIIVLSIQTKLGIKANILVDRLYDLWNGTSYSEPKVVEKNGARVRSQHRVSQADNNDPDNPVIVTNPMPVSTTRGAVQPLPQEVEPVAANSVFGGFGSLF